MSELEFAKSQERFSIDIIYEKTSNYLSIVHGLLLQLFTIGLVFQMFVFKCQWRVFFI